MAHNRLERRRSFLLLGSAAAMAWTTKTALGRERWFEPGRFADELEKTPPQGEGPFYPDKLPLDTDNDLLIVNDQLTPAVGEITHLTGKVTDVQGNPIRNATVEIWQVDQQGVYIHSACQGQERRDKNFQGFGRFLTGSSGDYYFRTIKPVAYPGRPPHIHVAINRGNQRLLTTQLYVAGDPRIEKDGLFRDAPAAVRKLLLVEFQPIPQSKIGELSANFNIVLGAMPNEKDHG